MTSPTGKELYTVRRQVFRVCAGFDVTGAGGAPIGYCEQKAFRLREDMRIYTDRTKSQELLRMRARGVIDFPATYDVLLPSGEPLGSLRRKGLASTFVRDSWQVLDGAGKVIGQLLEDSTFASLARRFLPLVALICPQRFNLLRVDAAGRVQEASPPIATYRTHFNPLIYRLSIAVHQEDPDLDDLMLLATGCLIAAIEGRQDND